MSHYMTALAMKQRDLKPATKIVLYWLADHHNGSTGLCCPSLNTLAAECEMARNTVIRHLDWLEESKVISRVKRARDNGSQTSTEYLLNFEQQSTKQPVPKRDRGCSKTEQGAVPKLDPHNLGRLNLGNKQPPNPQGDDLFSENAEQEKLDAQADWIETGFKQFWDDIWPSHLRKAGKADCLKVYTQACTGQHAKADQISPQLLNAATRRYIASVSDRQYLKGPLPWLRAPGWEPFMDGPDVVAGPSWDTLTESQRRMLLRRECPPSMMVDGKPNADAVALMAQVAP